MSRVFDSKSHTSSNQLSDQVCALDFQKKSVQMFLLFSFGLFLKMGDCVRRQFSYLSREI